MSQTTLIPLGGGSGGGGEGSNDISFSISITDSPVDGQIINISIPSYLTVSIAAAMLGSSGKALVAATAQTDFDVQKNGVSVGTVRFAAAGTVPSFIMASPTSFDGSSGDYLTLECPATADATLADIGITIKGTKS